LGYNLSEVAHFALIQQYPQPTHFLILSISMGII